MRQNGTEWLLPYPQAMELITEKMPVRIDGRKASCRSMVRFHAFAA